MNKKEALIRIEKERHRCSIIVEENQLYRTRMTQITRIYTGKNRIQLFKRKDMKYYTQI